MSSDWLGAGKGVRHSWTSQLTDALKSLSAGGTGGNRVGKRTGSKGIPK
jgi:hypothetical protein